jgi:hypothetical protein
MFFAEVARDMRVTPGTLRTLLRLADTTALKFRGKKRLSAVQMERIYEAIGPFEHCLNQGEPTERPCVFHNDVAEYLEVGYTTYRRWMKAEGLIALLPSQSGRRCLLPAEVNRIVEALAGRAYFEKGGRR